MRRQHWLLVGAASKLVAAWLLWNVILIEADLPPPAGTAANAPSGP